MLELARSLYRHGSSLGKDYGRVFGWLLVLQVTTYGYLFTSLIFTNHTFPNSWIFPYPSYKTLGEGRWLADIIVRLPGGSGVQPFQMGIAAALQGINGILFARFLGLERRPDIFLAAASLCLYPAFLDYYSFAIDHVTFALGDTFALLGILVWQHTVRVASQAAVSVLLFVFALASYQPKIALIGLLCLARTRVSLIDCHRGLRSVSAFYQAHDSLMQMNSAPDLLRGTFGSYGKVLRFYTVDVDYLAGRLRFLPLVAIGLGCLALLQAAYRRHAGAVVVVAGALAAIPVALRAVYVINNHASANAGRIVFVHGYALVFFLCCALRVPRMKAVALAVLGTLLYFFIITDAQESSAAAFKTAYDLSMLNRIVSRIENVAEDINTKPYALVMAGHYPEFPRSRYVRAPNRTNAPQLHTPAFESYRQPQMLNCFFGRDVLLMPTAAQVKGALASAQGRRPWQAGESVYVLDDTAVVLLETYRPDMPTTWTTEGSRTNR